MNYVVNLFKIPELEYENVYKIVYEYIDPEWYSYCLENKLQCKTDYDKLILQINSASKLDKKDIDNICNKLNVIYLD